MDQTMETAIYIIITIILSILLLKIGEKIGEYLASKREAEIYDFKTEFKKIIEEWKNEMEKNDKLD